MFFKDNNANKIPRNLKSSVEKNKRSIEIAQDNFNQGKPGSFKEYMDQLIKLSSNSNSNLINVGSTTQFNKFDNVTHYLNVPGINEDILLNISSETTNEKTQYYYNVTDKINFSGTLKNPFFSDSKEKPVLLFNKTVKIQFKSTGKIKLQFPTDDNIYLYDFKMYSNGANKYPIADIGTDYNSTKIIELNKGSIFYFAVDKKNKDEKRDNSSYNINIIDDNYKILDTIKVISESIYKTNYIKNGNFYINKIRLQTNEDTNIFKNSTKSWSLQRMQLWSKNKQILRHGLSNVNATGFNGTGRNTRSLLNNISSYDIYNKHALIDNSSAKEDFDLYKYTFDNITSHLYDYTYRSGIDEKLDDGKQYIEIKFNFPIKFKDIQYLVLHSNLNDNKYSFDSKQIINPIFNTSLNIYDIFNNEISEWKFNLNNIKPDISDNVVKENLSQKLLINNNTSVTLKGLDYDNFLKNGDFDNDTEYSKKLKDQYELDYNKTPISNAIDTRNDTWWKKYVDSISHSTYFSTENVYYVDNKLTDFVDELKYKN